MATREWSGSPAPLSSASRQFGAGSAGNPRLRAGILFFSNADSICRCHAPGGMGNFQRKCIAPGGEHGAAQHITVNWAQFDWNRRRCITVAGTRNWTLLGWNRTGWQGTVHRKDSLQIAHLPSQRHFACADNSQIDCAAHRPC